MKKTAPFQKLKLVLIFVRCLFFKPDLLCLQVDKNECLWRLKWCVFNLVCSLQRLQAKVLKLVDISYGGENGFNQAIELSAEVLSNVKFIQEKKLIGDSSFCTI